MLRSRSLSDCAAASCDLTNRTIRPEQTDRQTDRQTDMVPHKVRCPMKAWLPNAGVFATKVVVNRGRVAMLLALGRGGLRAAA